jgi:hypothetical protein
MKAKEVEQIAYDLFTKKLGFAEIALSPKFAEPIQDIETLLFSSLPLTIIENHRSLIKDLMDLFYEDSENLEDLTKILRSAENLSNSSSFLIKLADDILHRKYEVRLKKTYFPDIRKLKPYQLREESVVKSYYRNEIARTRSLSFGISRDEYRGYQVTFFLQQIGCEQDIDFQQSLGLQKYVEEYGDDVRIMPISPLKFYTGPANSVYNPNMSIGLCPSAHSLRKYYFGSIFGEVSLSRYPGDRFFVTAKHVISDALNYQSIATPVVHPADAMSPTPACVLNDVPIHSKLTPFGNNESDVAFVRIPKGDLGSWTASRYGRRIKSNWNGLPIDERTNLYNFGCSSFGTVGHAVASSVNHVVLPYTSGGATEYLLFQNQLAVRNRSGFYLPFARGGDSGGLVASEDGKAVGMIIAGGATTDFGMVSIVTPVWAVLNDFGADLRS